MNMIYNSPNYCVVEFRELGDPTLDVDSGFEIMDKTTRREIYLAGDMARSFRESVNDLIASSPTIEEVDDFLSRFDSMMQHPVVLH